MADEPIITITGWRDRHDRLTKVAYVTVQQGDASVTEEVEVTYEEARFLPSPKAVTDYASKRIDEAQQRAIERLKSLKV